MRTLNIRGALVFAALFLALAGGFGVAFPSDTSVHFSVESGFYDDPIVLEMTCAVPGADIYYTTDGSVPTARSYYYDGPITLENVEDEYHTLSDYTGISDEDYVPVENMLKANVIRAAVFRGDERLGDVRSSTYFVGIDREDDYGETAIVSLMMEEDDLFDYETGIYTLGAAFDEWYAQQEDPDDLSQLKGNYDYRGREWERPVYVEYMPADGRDGFAQQMGVRIKGATARRNVQKSLRLTARDEYGQNRVRYALFERGEGEYKQFVLRNGGNDYAHSHIREPLIHHLAQHMRMDTQRSQPAVVFINGEYWGIYTITEEYNAQYIEYSHGVESDNVIMVKRYALEEGQESDLASFEEMLRFISESDLTLEENYRKACAMLDVGSLADYLAVQCYVNNAESILTMDNNWMLWRARTLDSSNANADTRWRMMFFDADRSSYTDEKGSGWYTESLTHALFEPLTPQDSHLLSAVRSLYANDDFRRELVISLCDVRNIHFEWKKSCKEIEKLRNLYEPLMPDHFDRFGPQWIVDAGAAEVYSSVMDEISFFFQGRWEHFPQVIQQSLGLQSPAFLSLSCVGDGGVMVNHSVPDMQSGYTGLYFPDYPITLTTLETGEGRFVRWEGEGCEIADPYAMTTEVTFGGDFSVRAVFE